MAVRNDARCFLDRLYGCDGRGFKHIAFLDVALYDGDLCFLSKGEPSFGGGSALNDRLVSNFDNSFYTVFLHPNSYLQVSLAVVTSFFYNGACRFCSSMSHEQAATAFFRCGLYMNLWGF